MAPTEPSSAGGSDETPSRVGEDSSDSATSPSSTLRAEVAVDSAFAFTVSEAGSAEGGTTARALRRRISAAGETELVALESSAAERGDGAVALTDADDQPLSGPIAMIAMRDSADENLQRVFVLCSGDAATHGGRALVELLFRADRAERGESALEIGRRFIVPASSDLTGAIMRTDAEGATLRVNLPSGGGRPNEPMVLVYDVRKESAILAPTDIQMAPRR